LQEGWSKTVFDSWMCWPSSEIGLSPKPRRLLNGADYPDSQPTRFVEIVASAKFS
jgi:hypothetical protein